MFALQPLLTTFIAFNTAVNVAASPLGLFRRDVVAPRITSPTADSVWPIGSVQTVTWDTSDLPPPSQITNAIGQIILGFNSTDSLNLDFDHPLAKGFNITDGSVKVTVPNVTPRDDYLIVLFGDSGDTSPQFAITKISAPGFSSSSSSGSSPATTPLSTESLPIPTLSDITGSVTTDGSSITTDGTFTSTTVSDAPQSTATSSLSSSSSSSSTSSASAAAAQTTTATSAAWSLHHGGSFNALALCMAFMVMLITV
ncbi:hypothetical protein CPB84DRAFT_1677535 [Gymnopilus junonius]|uniref:Ser-Thr-rich glycosyl-phosphatidyl-inositol-anchored membrane family-domain-containing protein n=1 Tax=Gymnopilus junonius TaxID=109634 RepID=A0A9P5NRL3_GYMJU|nr:hypothetical protein CPB84DRAFT_1677535 [Gymnopilus junonius]